MANIEPSGKAVEPLALTDFPHIPGVITPKQRANLSTVGELCSHWFNWNPLVGSPGREGRAPINPHTGGMGAVNGPDTAGTRQEALDNIPRGGGVGVLLSQTSADLVCLDLDHVIRGNELHWLGQHAVDFFKDTYTEVSPSGTGLRIFTRGVVSWPHPGKGSEGIIGPLKVGAWPDGEEIKFEVYHCQPNKWVRCTGAVLLGTAGVIASAQDGIDWALSKMAPAAATKGGGVSAIFSPDKGRKLGLEEVFAQVGELRGTPDKDSGSITADIMAKVASQPRGKLADAWKGKGDRSQGDYSVCCEVIRRGAGSLETVLDVWGASPAGNREKFAREDYQRSTVDRAARAVLAAPPKHWFSVSSAGPVAVELSQVMADSIGRGGDKLTSNKSGRIASEVGNMVLIFRHDPALLGVLAFNDLSQKSERRKSWRIFDLGANEQPGPVTDDDLTRLQMWLSQKYGLKLDHKEVARGIDAAARDASYDPLASRLAALGDAWDGVPRVRTWLTDFAKVDATGCAEYVGEVGACFLVGAVARALRPGCKHDTVLAVEGSGGGGKSTMFAVLADAVASDLFTDNVHDVSNTTALVEGAGGRWVVEIAELAGIRRAADVEALKAALTRQSDTHRRPYEVYPREYPRRFVFVATTNRSEYLADPSGALLRRFWPVRTLATEQDPIDREALAAVAPQLWGEAVRMHEQGHKWFIDESDGVAFTQWLGGRESRREDGAFHDEIVEFLMGHGIPAPGLPIKTIAQKVGDMRTADGDTASLNRLAESLRAVKLVSVKKGGRKLWYYGAGALMQIEDWKRERAGR